MSHPIENLAQQLLDAAKFAGADAADALVVSGVTQSIEVTGGQLEMADRAEGTDLGLRVFVGQRQACVSISDQSPQAIAEMAERCVAMAKVAPDDPFCGLATADQLARDWDIDALQLHDAGHRPTPSQLQDTALQAEAAALAVSGVSQVQSAASGYSDTELFLAASNGFAGGYARSGFSTSCVAISGEGLGMERDYAGEARTYLSELPGPQEIGQLAGDRAVASVGATQPPTGSYPVLFDERIASSLIGHLTAAINGTAIARGASWLKDALGEEVLPKGIDLIENPLRPRAAGSRPFDAEGLPVAKRAVVRGGILQNWTLDLATARKLGLAPTANARRGTSAPPSPSLGNLALTQGNVSREDLIAQMGCGLLVTGLIGSTINPTTGDYSRGANGFWVENGEITRPVNQCTIAGNLRNMLRGIQPANDARGHLSRVVPSLLVEGMTLAGA